MQDRECVELLQWALPRLGLRWQGFRRVRRQVCRRIDRRREELGLAGAAAYRRHLETHTEEWAVLDGLCRVTISRFSRDRGVFERLGREVVPVLAAAALADGRTELQTWSAGCASGEEPYTLALLWAFEVAPRFPALELRILATDVDEAVLRRARDACYPAGSLRELPEAWRARGFLVRGRRLCLRPELRRGVELRRRDVRVDPPGGPFDLVLCRNLAFTYFGPDLQREVAARLAGCLRPGGALVVGSHEAVPAEVVTLEPWPGAPSVYRRRPGSGACRVDPRAPAGQPE